MQSAQANTGAQTLTLQSFADLLEESRLVSSLDLKQCIIHQVAHPQRGMLILVNTSAGQCACIPGLSG